MGTQDENIHDIADLQIFITRSTTQLRKEYGALPLFILADGGHTTRGHTNNRSFRDHHDDQSKNRLRYTVIANSEAVEIIDFPFDQGMVSHFVNRLSGDNSLSLGECINFGSELFDFVFRKSVCDLLRKLEEEHHLLRITIVTHLPELAFLPWELMCDHRQGLLPHFLSCKKNISFSRSLRLFSRQNFQAIKLGDSDNDHTLRILLITANPPGFGAHLNTEAEERLLRFIIADQPALENVKLYILHDANVNSIRDYLDRYRPHVLHLSCHGGYSPKDKLGFVMLCSPNNPLKPDCVSSYRFALIIQEIASIQLVVVSSCYSAIPSQISPFSGIAQSIHASGINNVVALQFPLQDKTGHIILLNFYNYLLREKKTVERSVALVRRYLVINGYPFSESFGITLFQLNSTQYWPGATARRQKLKDQSKSFENIISDFDSFYKSILIEEIEKELKKVKSDPRDVNMLTTEEAILAHKIFYKFETGIDIITTIMKSSLEPSAFLEVIAMAAKICQIPHEKEYLNTSFFISEISSLDEYSENEDEKISEDFSLQNIKIILEKALNVNGTDETFMVLYDKTTKRKNVFIKSLKDVDKSQYYKESIGGTTWANLRHLTAESGCALALTGDRRVKIFVFREQIAEFRYGSWIPADHKEFCDKVIDMTSKTGLEQQIIVDVLRKSLQSSNIRRGLTIMIQMDDNICDKCSDKRLLAPQALLRKQKITELKSKQYLDKVKGDGAVIISKEGYTLATHAHLVPSDTTTPDTIPGTGTRHSSAQMITRETDAIAVVVSEDGPITVFKTDSEYIRFLVTTIDYGLYNF